MAAGEPNIAIETGSAAAAILRLITRAQAHLEGLSPQDAAINATLSLAVVAASAVISWGLGKLLGRRQKRATLSDGTTEGAGAHTPVTLRLARAFLALAALYLIAMVWGIDPVGWAAGAEAAALAAGVGAFVLSALLVAAIWEGGSNFVSSAILARAERAREPRRAAQLRSLAPLARGAVQTLVAIFGSLLVIAQLGLDLAPLLAGAGVIGIAIGFGAQTLVKDYLTGFSMVLEDIAAVGDVVRIGESAGLVESMNLRTIRLRDLDGTLHVIPYSEAQIVHNLTKSFSYYVLDLSIAYSADVDRALATIRAVGDDMQADPTFGALILAPIEVFGVDRLADSGVMLKARIKTVPIKQWEVGREYNRRIKLAFDEAGIEIPFPHLKVVVDSQPTRSDDAA